MFKKAFSYAGIARVGMVMIIAIFLAVPTCYAGGAAVIVPDDGRLAPEGSYISDERKAKIAKKVQAFKAERERKAEKERQEKCIQKEEAPKPKEPEEK